MNNVPPPSPETKPTPERASAPKGLASPRTGRRRTGMTPAGLVVLAVAALAVAGVGRMISDRVELDPAARLQDWNNATAGGVTLPMVEPGAVEQAIASMNLPPPAVGQLRADLEAGKVRLAWVRVWDDVQQDGDVLAVSSAGYSVQLGLLNAGTTVAVPLAPGAPVSISGVKDGGGGGVTAGIATMGGNIATPVLAPGQVITMPVRVP